MNKVELDDKLTREEWLALRRRGIGGSDASVICGINKYKSVIELWMDKTDQTLEDEDSEAAYWGRTIEPIIREEFALRSGLGVRTVPYMYQHKEYKFMLANLDGEVDDPQYGTCIFEAKTATIFKSAEWGAEIPEEYYLQLQHYMAVTGYQGAYIAALIGGNRFIWKFIQRDEKVIDLLIKLEERFWKYVKDREIPPLDGSEASKQLLAKLYPQAEYTKTIELPEEALLLINNFEDSVREEKKITEKKEEATNKLKAMLMDAEVGTIRDREVSWKNIRSERLDSKELKANVPELYKDYVHTTTYRKFNIK